LSIVKPSISSKHRPAVVGRASDAAVTLTSQLAHLPVGPFRPPLEQGFPVGPLQHLWQHNHQRGAAGGQPLEALWGADGLGQSRGG
jgi:hypothetical protein